MSRRMNTAVERLAIGVSIAVLMGSTTVIGGAAPVSSAASGGGYCPPVPVWVNTPSHLHQFDGVSGAEIGAAVPLHKVYGDIAWSADGSRLYGVDFATHSALDEIDPVTGAILDSMPLTAPGGGPFANTPNALTAIDDRTLLVGIAYDTTIYAIDLATGLLSHYAAFPDGVWSSGDFSVLPDGDIVALGATATEGIAYRIHPDRTLTQIGTLPSGVYGAAQSGGNLYIVIGSSSTVNPDEGNILAIALSDIPAAGTGPLPTLRFYEGAMNYYGASSIQDGNVCDALALIKSPSRPSVSAAGETITYTFEVRNVTDVTISAIELVDTQAAPAGQLTSGPTCPVTTLAPRATMTCTATYTVTQADLDHGRIDDSAHATGRSPGGHVVESNRADATVSVQQDPRLELAKSASPGAGVDVGDAVNYTFAVQNSGNVTVRDVRIDESAFSGTGPLVVECPSTPLVPGASMTCSATYRATQHDMDAGRIVNEARAVGVDPSGGSVASDPSDAEVATNQRPALKLVKSVQVDDPTSLWEGVELEYVFVVTNAGNVTIDGIGIEELEFTGSTELEPPACEVSTLAPGAQTVCRANYIATIADLDGIDNTARATGETPTGQPVVSDPSSARVPFEVAPGLELVKSADVSSVSAAGQRIRYSFLVTNTGNVPISDLAVHEENFSGAGRLGPVTCPGTPSAILPGQFIECYAEYIAVIADVTGEPLVNTARATGEAATGGRIESERSTVDLPTVDLRPAEALAATGWQVPPAIAPIATGILMLGVLLVGGSRWQRRTGRHSA